MFKRLLIAVGVLLSHNSYAKYDVQECVLDNGLRIVFIKKSPSTVACFSVWYKCGSIQDFPSKSGVAHFLEHMAFEIDGRKFGNFLENIGAENNAFTSYDKICFYEIFDKKHFDEIAKNEAQRMRKIDIDNKSFQAEKGAILEERNFRIDNDPDGCSSEDVLANIFNRKPGGVEIIGWKHEIQSITKEDIQKYHDAWFAPNNAVIVIVGDLNFEEIQSIIKKHFGEIHQKDVGSIIKSNYIPNNKRLISYSSPKMKSFSLEFIYPIYNLNFRKKLALKLAIRALNLPESKVKKSLEFILKKTLNCSFGTCINNMFAYNFVNVSLICSSINELDSNKNLWEFFKKTIIKNGITQGNLDIIKRKILAEQAYEQDDVSGVGNYLGYQIISGDSIDEIANLRETMQSISLKECNDVLRDLFSQEPSAIIENRWKGFDRE